MRPPKSKRKIHTGFLRAFRIIFRVTDKQNLISFNLCELKISIQRFGIWLFILHHFSSNNNIYF